MEWKQGSSNLFRSWNWWSNSAWHTSNTKLWKTSEIEEATERYRYKDFVLQWWTDHLYFKNSLKLKNTLIDNVVTLWLSFVEDIHGRYTDKVESYRNKGVIKPLTPAWDINVYSKCWQKNIPLRYFMWVFSWKNCTIDYWKILTTMNSLSLVKNLQGLSFKIHNHTQRCKCCA